MPGRVAPSASLLQQGSAATPGFTVPPAGTAKPDGCKYQTPAAVCGPAPGPRSFYPLPALAAAAFLRLFPSPLPRLSQPPLQTRSGSCCASRAQQIPTPLSPTLCIKKRPVWGCFVNPHFTQHLAPHLAFPRCLSALPKPPRCWAG